MVYTGLFSVLPFYHQTHSELINSLQNKLLSCLAGEVAQNRSVLAGGAAAGQACAGSHPRDTRSFVPLPSRVLTFHPDDESSEVARFGDGPWASCVGFTFPVQQRELTEPETNCCQLLHFSLNIAVASEGV